MRASSSLTKGGASKTKANKASVGSKKLVVRRRKLSSARKLSHKHGKLPSFQLQSKSNDLEPADNSSIPTEHVDENLELPCDTLMAIQSLQNNAQGLHIPLNGNHQIQILLENQIFQRFDEDHASTIMSELESLIRSNKIRRLSCQEECGAALVLTKDYINAVWDAHEQYSATAGNTSHTKVGSLVIAWFVECLHEWTGLAVSEEAIRQSWDGDTMVSTSADCRQSMISFCDALRVLLDLRLLLRKATSATSTTSRHYYLWLPQWGLVLKQWNEARQQLLAFIGRSKGGEVSESNLLNKNRHRCISTGFLLDDLVHRGKLRIIQRPFGKFIKKVDSM